jgi:uncharacterized membrane protein (DUF485 family)
MFSIGLVLFFVGWFVYIWEHSKRYYANTTLLGIAGWGIVLGIALMVISIVIHLWKVLP